MNLILPKSPRVLITRTDAMGDVILTTPVYRALKKGLPGCHITVLCRDYAEPVLRGNEHIDEIITFDSEVSPALADVTNLVKESCCDIAVALFPSRFVATVLHDARIPIRIGSARRFHSWKFTHRMNQSRKRNEKSEAQYNLDLLKALGINSSDIIPEVRLQDFELANARRLLDANSVSEKFVVLHPGSGGSAVDWPLNRFVDLCEKLQSKGIACVITGSSLERVQIDKSFDCDAGCAVSLAGKTDVRELAAVLALADVVVANSTGPLHLAAAVGTDTIGLFPRSASMSPVRWAPPVSNACVLQPDNESANLDIPVDTVVREVVAACLATGR